ncbi:type 2 lantipeptide synthetase LanM [Dolosigranulum pigrum]|nr:type 2 lantipeptide synthetase LanM [Dolosigranulum pigrum]
MFYGFHEPFLKLAILRFENYWKNIPGISDNVFNKLLIYLYDQLAEISYRTLILELNIAREENKLAGETSEERYNYFSTQYLSDNYWLILEEYPVMFRLMCEATQKWINNTTRFIDRILSDKDDLEKTFKIEGELNSIELNTSDVHNGGQTVIILHFEEGTSVVYKPRDLKMDVTFQSTIKWFNEVTKSHLYSLKIINHTEYGWVEYIPHEECKDYSDFKNYYTELGQLLFLFYLLRGNDIHYENIIAKGKHPVLIDLETLFHNNTSNTSGIDTAADRVNELLENSVRTVGILPNLVWAQNGKNGVDISAISTSENKEIPIEQASITNVNKDNMKVEYKTSTLASQKNNPYIIGEEISLTSYHKYLKKGFIESYTKIKNINKKEIINQVENYKEIYARQILRPTQYYTTLIQISLHPDFLRSAIDREMLFSKLWIYFDENNSFRKVSEIEFTSLLKNDIPWLISNVSKNNITTKDGSEIESIFKHSSIALVKEKINILGDKDLTLQVELIETALNYDSEYNKAESQRENDRKIIEINDDKLNKNHLDQQLLEISTNIGDYLINQSFIGMNGDVSWIDMNVIGEKANDWNMVPTSMDLYSGLSGIMIYFIFLYKETKQNKYLIMVKRCYKSIINYIKNVRKRTNINSEVMFGGFSGETPIIYALTILEEELGGIFDLDELEKIRSWIFKECKKNISVGNEHDIIIGSSGVIAILLRYYDLTSNDAILEVCQQYAEQIIDNYIEMDNNSIAWIGIASRNALGGFAHGVSGIVWALSKLYSYLPDERYIEVIEKALRYEDYLYSEDDKNWVDRRETEEGIEYNNLSSNMPVAWCHGASGILLSRASLKKHNLPLSEKRKNKIDEDIEIAVRTTLKNGFGHSHCLCHGDLGNMLILKYASSELNTKNDIDKRYDIYMSHLISQLKDKWECGIPYKNSPGMMLWLSGIGFGLLSLMNEDLPFILLLE